MENSLEWRLVSCYIIMVVLVLPAAEHCTYPSLSPFAAMSSNEIYSSPVNVKMASHFLTADTIVSHLHMSVHVYC